MHAIFQFNSSQSLPALKKIWIHFIANIIMNSSKSSYSLGIRETQNCEISDCMVCAIKTSIQCAPLDLPTKGFCKHNTDGSFSRQPCFEERQFCLWVSNGILLLITIETIWKITILTTNSYPGSNVDYFLMISDQLFSICGIVVYGTHSLKWRQWLFFRMVGVTLWSVNTNLEYLFCCRRHFVENLPYKRLL